MEEPKYGKDTVVQHAGGNDIDTGEVVDDNHGLKRHLSNRKVQLIAIGGSIGTAMFVSIGSALNEGGPASLFLSYTLYACVLALVSNAMAEMAIYMPVSASFIRHASVWVDDAWGFMAGWNFFFYESILIPFEISALNLILKFWRDDIPVGAVCAACIVSYGLINVAAVRYYGEAEFWLSWGKLLLMGIVFAFTFVTMVGGNPHHDSYGFRYWKTPGAFAEYLSTGSMGRWEGFLGSLWAASFAIVGPEYMAMVAGEAKLPRITLKRAFKSIYIRFGVFFIGGALCVGIVIPYNDPTLESVLGSSTGAASPYVIAMQNLGVTGLPHLVNALLFTSIFSAGNAYTYCASRTLHGLAIDGHAPKFLAKCTRNGVPLYCLSIVMVFPFLSLLQLSSGAYVVLTWLTNIVTAGGIIDYIVICVNYIFFYRACMAQGVNRRELPYYGYFQPWSTVFALCFEVCVVVCYGYAAFLPGHWSISDFFTHYAMVFLGILTFFGWKIIKRTKFVKPHEADLVWDRPAIERYELTTLDRDIGFWNEMLAMVRIRRKKFDNEENRQ
ncbi:putative general amino acid permease [Talaromyces proteolyticus]|uniref:General amino acid permease n=1 Tax=Talaromyces proteolyticus TaxID=1131652 RepID=A0AAD4PSM8_9EURO|nr:putative general amino acid permease [Talaromyces proteolyticus]KAH8691656.1 putative general amino acid permease [Talaromyces proteolyticus]